MNKFWHIIPLFTGIGSIAAAFSVAGDQTHLKVIITLVPLLISIFFVIVCCNTNNIKSLDYKLFIFIGRLVMLIFIAVFFVTFFKLVSDAGTAFILSIITGSTVPLSLVLLILGLMVLKTKNKATIDA